MSADADPRPTILILSYSDLRTDPRVQRQFETLADGYRLVAAGIGGAGRDDVCFIPIVRERNGFFAKAANAVRLLAPSYRTHSYRTHYDAQRWFRSLRRRLAEAAEPFDLVLANEYETLPLAVDVAGSRPVVFDAHEYSPGQSDPRSWFGRRWIAYRERLLRDCLPRCAATMTVSPGLAELYDRLAGVRPEVVLNAPEFVDQSPSPVDAERIELVHHGAAAAARRLDVLIDAMRHLDDQYRLTLFLASHGHNGERDRLAQMVADSPTLTRRVSIQPAIPMPEIACTLNRFDLGLHFLSGHLLNHRHALPNKLFEFVQARLGVVFAAGVDCERLIQQHGFGVSIEAGSSDDPSPKRFAEAIAALDVDAIREFKRNADRVAPQLCSEVSRQAIRRIVDGVMERSQRPSHREAVSAGERQG